MLKLFKHKQQNKWRRNPFLPKSVNRKSSTSRRGKGKARGSLNAQSVTRIVFGTIGFLIVILLIMGVHQAVTSSVFSISEIIFFGNNKIDDTTLMAELEGIKGQNIFLTRSSDIESQLAETNLFFDKITVRKILPNRLKISLTERDPNLTLINLSGVYLVDNNGLVIEKVVSDKINFSDENINIIKGFGDPNADYVKTRMMLDRGILSFAGENEEQQNDESNYPEFDFWKVKLKHKLWVLEKIRKELLIKVDEIFDSYSKYVSEQDFASLPRVFVLENVDYDEHNQIEPARLILTNEVTNLFSGLRDYIVEKISWDGEYLVTFIMTDKREVSFGTTRNTSQQIEDFLLISDQLKLEGKGFKTIDLSSKKVSVRL